VNRLRMFASDQTGQVLVITALSMVVLLGFVGFAIDVGHLRLVKSQMQSAADAAALAAGLEIRVCSSTPGCPAMQSAVQTAMKENGMTAATFLSNCSGSVGTGVTVTLNDPPCASSTDPNKGNTKYVEAVVTRNVTTHFASIFGFNNIKVSARAEAKRGVGPCIYALDPHGAQAILVLAGLGMNSTCGIVDESDSSSALYCLIGLGTAPRIAITGRAAGLLGPLLCGSVPPPVLNVPVPAVPDPLSYLPAPPHATDACPATSATGTNFTGSKTAINLSVVNVLLNGNTYTFNPGVYCGGINITAAVLLNLTFKPGVYILRDGPGIGTQGGFNITLSLLSNITANGVMFYNEGNVTTPSASVGGFSITAPSAIGLSNVNITAATSGEYGGVLFFQAHGITTSGTYLASVLQGSKIEGAIYEPDAKVAYAVGAVSSNYNILVAKDINFTGEILSVFGSNYSALANGSPLQSDVAVLVQ
jgi:hypothetical protein